MGRASIVLLGVAMTQLEQDAGTYWRTSQTLRGLREGYPVVAEGLLGLVAVNHAGDRLGELASSNSVSRFKPDTGGKVIDAFSFPPRPACRYHPAKGPCEACGLGGGIDDLI
jgi:hypothetical protein